MDGVEPRPAARASDRPHAAARPVRAGPRHLLLGHARQLGCHAHSRRDRVTAAERWKYRRSTGARLFAAGTEVSPTSLPFCDGVECFRADQIRELTPCPAHRSRVCCVACDFCAFLARLRLLSHSNVATVNILFKTCCQKSKRHTVAEQNFTPAFEPLMVNR